MSLQAYNAVWEQSAARGTDLLVLLALADFADEHGWSYPSVDAIAKKARISQRAVQDRLRSLVALREIDVEIQAGRYGTNRYHILFAKAKGVQDLQGAGSAGGVQMSDAKRDADLHPNRKESLGIVRNQKTKPFVMLDKSEHHPKEVWKSNQGIQTLLSSLGATVDFSLNGKTGLTHERFWTRISALTDGTKVFYDDELRKYIAWLSVQPPSRIHTNLQRGFTEWIRKAIAIDGWQEKRKEFER